LSAGQILRQPCNELLAVIHALLPLFSSSTIRLPTDGPAGRHHDVEKEQVTARRAYNMFGGCSPPDIVRLLFNNSLTSQQDRCVGNVPDDTPK
jgi:hypothetical protein